MKRWTMAMVALALAAALAGCSGGSAGPALELEVKTDGMAFVQKELTVNKGQMVKLVLNNPDVQLHDWSVDKLPAKVKASHGDDHGHSGKGPEVHVAADAGKQGTLEFIPSAAGTYTYYCTVPGHKDAGMTGTLVVK